MKPELQRRVQRYGWDKAAPYYDDSWKEQLKPAQDKLLQMIDLKSSESVLELACGSGLVTVQIAEATAPGGELLATDISEVMIELARERTEDEGFEKVQFKRMDAEDLDLPDKRFDAAVSALGLMYVPDPLKSIKEMNRVLKASGRAGIAIWGERKNCGWAEIFPIMDKRVASDVCPMFFQQGTGDILKNSMTQAGFDEIEMVRFSVYLHFPSDEIAIKAAFAGGPVALAYQKFDKETRLEAHKEYLTSIAPFKKSDGYRIPGEFVVATGEKLRSV